MAQGEAEEQPTSDQVQTRRFTDVSNSKSAFQVLARPLNKPGQGKSRQMRGLATKAKEHPVQLRCNLQSLCSSFNLGGH